MSPTITREEWLAELERVMRERRQDADGMTSEELAEAWGCCKRIALERLKLMRGRLIVGYKSTVGIAGRAGKTPCYRLMPAKAAKKR